MAFALTLSSTASSAHRPTKIVGMNAPAQPSVLGKPWYWVLIGLGVVLMVVLLVLTVANRAGAHGAAAQAPAAAEASESPEGSGAAEGEAVIEYGDGSDFEHPLPPGTDATMKYLNLDQSEPIETRPIQNEATVRVTGVNFDATAEALAEDPWADLMLEDDEKLAIVDFEIINHAKDLNLSVDLMGMIELEDEAGNLYPVDIVQVALDQPEIPNTDFPEGETVRTVGVFYVPKSANASNTMVRLFESSDVDSEGSGAPSDPDAFMRTYRYMATQ